jgi:hypothetical protein
MSAAMKYLSDLGNRFLRVLYHTQIGPDKTKSFFDSERRPLYSIVYSIIEEGQEKGQIRTDMESHELGQLIINFHRGLIYDWILKNGSYDLQEEAEKIFKIFYDGIRPSKTRSRSLKR